MTKKIAFFIMKLFNLIPIIHLSLDENFDTITYSIASTKKAYRLSLIALNFGIFKLYIFTFLFTPKHFQISNFSTYKVLEFNKVQCRKTGSEITIMANEYENNTLLNINIDERSRQEEYLKIKTSENNDSLSNIFDKVNYYTTVLLAFSAALVYAYSKIIELQFNITTLAIFYLALINLLDLFDLIFLLRHSVSVSGFHRSTFKSLKANRMDYALTKSLYFDWIASSDDVKYYAGLTKNTEMRSFRVILIGLILLICTTLTSNHVAKEQPSSLLYLQNYTSLAESR